MSANPPPEKERRWPRLRRVQEAIRRSRLGHEVLTTPWAMVVLASLFLSFMIAPHFGFSIDRYQAGMFADHTIKANRDFDVIDTSSTEKRRQDAISAVLPVYDHDARADQRQVKRLADAFAESRLFFGWTDSGGATKENEMGVASLLSKPAIEEQETKLAQQLGLDLDRKDFDALFKKKYSPQVEAEIRDLLNYALSRLIVVDRKVLLEQIAAQGAEKAITLRELGNKKERTFKEIEKIADLPVILDQVDRRAKQNIEDPAERALVLKIADGMIAPTVNFNLAATEELRMEAANKVGPSIIHFRKNQLIVAEGQPITEEQMLVLGSMRRGAGAAETLLIFVALVIVLAIIISALFVFGARNIRKFKPSMNDYAFLLSTAALAGLLMWLAKTISQPLADSYPWLTEEAIRVLFPVAGVCMLVRFLLYSEAAIVWLGFVALMSGLFMDGSIGYALFVLAGSVVGAHRIGKVQAGAQVVKAGLSVSLINAVMMFAVQVIGDPASLLSTATFVNVGAAAIGGLLSGPFMLAVVHPFEALFSYTSNLRLIELANLNNPLLGRMLVEAPGTYHHCLMVSALAEKGAESISVNPLLAKVAGLYHDIGKVVKPHYFIENQMEGENNPHNELPPHMSSLILINHVREGLELAKRYRIGRRVEKIIAEHHGRSRIHYFYNRAKQMEAAGNLKINEEDFRYRGPYPQTKESALVMLADVVEAATRSLKNPTPARIESLVSELIGNIYNDGQLDECEMTLKDLHRVAQNFATILTGRYHGRIAYPENEQPRKGKVVNIAPPAASKEEPGH